MATVVQKVYPEKIEKEEQETVTTEKIQQNDFSDTITSQVKVYLLNFSHSIFSLCNTAYYVAAEFGQRNPHS